MNTDKALHFIKNTLLVCLLSILVNQKISFANTEVMYNIDGSTPYMIVYKDNVGASKRAPGIYKADGSNWIEIFQGKLLSLKGKHGVAHPLKEVSRFTSLFDSIIVIDGELVLFNWDSDQKNPESFTNFSNSSVLRDPLSRLPIKLNEITSLDQISVVEVDSLDDYQTILVSVSQESLYGNGFTFFANLSFNSEGPRIIGVPYIINYDFLKSHELKKLYIEEEESVFSKNILRNMMALLEGSNSVQAQNWVSQISLSLPNLTSPNDLPVQIENLPLLKTETGKVFVKEPLTENFSSSRYTVLDESFNLLNGEKKVVFQSHVTQGKKTEIKGEFSRGKKSKVFTSFDSQSSLAVIDSEIVWLDERMILKKVEDIEGLKNISHRHSDSFDQNGREVNIMVLSMEFEDSSENVTEAFYYEVEDEISRLTKRVTLANEFFEKDELEYRLVEHEGTPLFDNITKVPKGKSYGEVEDSHTARVDLTTSNDGELKYFFMYPIDETLLSRDVYYMKYNSKGLSENPSGFYLGVKNSSGYEEKKLIKKAELISYKTGEGEQIINLLPVSKSEISITKKNSLKVVANLFALDPSFKAGEDGIELMLRLFPDGTDNVGKAYSSSIEYINLKGMKLNQLDGAQVFFNRATNGITKFFLALNFVQQQGSKFFPKGGVRVYSLNLEVNPSTGKLSIAEDSYINFEGEELTQEEVSTRVVFDESRGEFFWIMDPDKARDSRDYALKNLANNSVIYPAVDKRYNINFNYNSQKLEESMGGDSLSAAWGNQSKYDASWYRAGLSRYSKSEDAPEIFGQFSGEDYYKYFIANSVLDIKDANGYRLTLTKDTHEEMLNKLSEQMATLMTSETPKHLFFVADSPLEKEVIKTFLSFIHLHGHEKAKWERKYSDDFYYVRPNNYDVAEIRANYKAIRESKKKYVFADLASFSLSEPFLLDDESKETPAWELPLDNGVQMPLTVPYYLLTDGRELTLDEIKKGITPQNNTIFIGTTSEFQKMQQSIQPAIDVGLMDHVEVIWDNVYDKYLFNKSSELYKKVSRNMVRVSEKNLFEDLDKFLEKIASIDEKNGNYIIEVDSSIKETLQEIIFTWYAFDFRNDEGETKWNLKNKDLNLVVLPSSELGEDTDLSKLKFQQGLQTVMEAMKASAKNKKGIIFGDLKDIIDYGPLKMKSSKKALNSEELKKVTLVDDKLDKASQESVAHYAWHLVSEEVNNNPNALSKAADKKKLSTVFIGTKKEIERFLQDTSFEGRLGLHDAFETISLSEPSVEDMVSVIYEYFDSEEFKRLGYRFAMKGKSEENARSGIIDYFANKVMSYSNMEKKSVVLMFSKALDELSSICSRDIKLRKLKVVNEGIIETVITKTFNLAINPKILPPEDPLVLINNSDEFIEKLGELNKLKAYDAPYELKQLVAEVLKSQSTSTSSSIAIPSSVVLYGDSSTGKTFLFHKIADVLNLDYYDYTNPNKEGVGALVVDVNKIVPDPSNMPADEKTRNTVKPLYKEQLTISEQIAHINNFLSQPNGYRGFILFDDVHKASDSTVLNALMDYIKSIFEAKEGVFKVGTSDGIKEIPVRNLNLFMTLNPSEAVIDALAKDPNAFDDYRAIAKSLEKENASFEPSIFQRWGRIINLSEFHSEAKGSALLGELRGAAKNSFTQNKGVLIPTAEAVEDLVSSFPKANAREFLANATMAISEKAFFAESPLEETVATGKILVPTSSLHVIKPEEETIEGEGVVKPVTSSGHRWDRNFEASGSDRGKIVKYVNENFSAIPINSEAVDSKVLFTDYLVNNFRNYFHSEYLGFLLKDKNFSVGSNRKFILNPFMLALEDLYVDVPVLPRAAYLKAPGKLGVSTISGKGKFRSLVKSGTAADDMRYFMQIPIKGSGDVQSESFLFEPVVKQRNRLNVFADYYNRIQHILKEVQSYYLRVDKVRDLPSSEQWVDGLKQKEQTFKGFTDSFEQIKQLFFEFNVDMVADDLHEVVEGYQNYPEINQFETSRIFLSLVDQAIAGLPNEDFSYFMIKVLEEISSDVSLVQKVDLLNYLFESQVSLFQTTTPQKLMQTLHSSKIYKDYRKENLDKLSKGFKSRCSNNELYSGKNQE